VLAVAPLPVLFSSSATAAGETSGSGSSTSVSASSLGGPAVGQSGSSTGTTGLGTANAEVGALGLDLKLLSGLLGPIGGDTPLNVTLNQASAPQDGTDTDATTSVVKVRDGLLGDLRVPAQDADDDLLKADVASSTVRTESTYSQAYATASNIRLFLPFVSLPAVDASDGVLRVDSVSAVATCDAGVTPTAATQLPAQLTLLGQNVQLPNDGQAHVSLPLLGSISVHVGPKTTLTSTTANATVNLAIDIDLLGLVDVSGQITLAQASCSAPQPSAVATSTPSATNTSPPAGAGTGTGSAGSTVRPTGAATPSAGGTTSRTSTRPTAGKTVMPFTGSGSFTPMADAHRATRTSGLGPLGRGDDGSTTALTTASAMICAGFLMAALYLAMGRGRRIRILPSRWLPRHAKPRV
jgi:hypothetical protein